MAPVSRAALIWGGLAAAVAVPLAVSAMSPLLAWRQPVYIAAGLAGVLAMALLLVQPLLAGGYLPGVASRRGRAVHQIVGAGLVLAVIVHVGGLWITSPPDVIDALFFASPTVFSVWGVVAMWGIFAAAVLAVFRASVRPPIWRIAHTTLVVGVVITSVVHAVLIEGTMGQVSKLVLCVLVIGATAKVVFDRRAWRFLGRRAPRG